MSDSVSIRHGTRVLLCSPDGPAIATERDAADLLSVVFSEQAQLLAVPVARLDPGFFSLRTGVAGAIVQKVVQYHRQLVIVGDISEHVAASTALRDFVVEANRGRHTWFVADLAELDERLAADTQIRS
jgi:hypothetical protein